MAEGGNSSELTPEKDLNLPGAELFHECSDNEHNLHIMISGLKMCETPHIKDVIKKVNPSVFHAESLFSEGEYRKSLESYTKVLHLLLSCRKTLENSQDKKILESTAHKLLSRAEEIKLLCPVAKPEDELKYCDSLEAEMARDYPTRSFNSISGFEDLKTFLKERVILPLKFPKLFKRRPMQAILLYGYPGTGKSLFLEAAAYEAGVKLLVFNLYYLGHRLYGGPQKAESCIKTVFQIAHQKQPCILCLEDLDVLSKNDEVFRRGKVETMIQTEFLTRTYSDSVILIGTTQRPWLLDASLRRRFLRRYVTLPSIESRRDMIRQYLDNHSHNMSGDDILEVARQTDGFTGADVLVLMKVASMEIVRKLSTAQYFKKIWVHEERITDRKAESVSEKQEQTASDGHDADSSSRDRDSTSTDAGSQALGHVSLPLSGQNETSQEDVKSGDAKDCTETSSGEEHLHHTAKNTNPQQSESAVTIEQDAVEKGDTCSAEDLCAMANEAKDTEADQEETDKVQAEHGDLYNDSKLAQHCGSSSEELTMVEKFIPCESTEKGAVKATFLDLPEEKLYLQPEISKEAMVTALSTMRSSVSEEDAEHMRDFIDWFDTP